MSFLGSLRTWLLLFNNKINPQKYNLPNNSALPVLEVPTTVLSSFHENVTGMAHTDFLAKAGPMYLS